MRLERIGPPAEGPRFNLLVTLTRAREGQAVVRPLLRGSSPTRSVAPKPLRGLGRASLRHSGLVLFIHIHWRVGAEDLARRSFGLLVSPARCGSSGSGRLLRAPALTSFVTLTRAREGQAVVRPLLRGSSPTRSVAPKPLRGLGRASLRHSGLVLFIHIHWRVGAEDLARRSFGLLVSPARCCSTGSGRLLRAPALTSLSPLRARARARPWSARCYGVARQRDRSRQNR